MGLITKINESIVFSSAAASLIVLGFYSSAPETAAPSGAGGENLTTLIAYTPTMTETIAEWETPPEIIQQTSDLNAPTLSLDVPQIQTLVDLPPQTSPLMATPIAPLGLTAPQAPAQPEPPAPPKDLERERMSQVTPTVRPKRLVPTPQKSTPKPQPKVTPKSQTAQRAPQPKATVTSNQSSAGQAAQKAAGSGGGSQAGNNTVQAQTGAQRAKSQRLEAAWHARIRSRIQSRQRYPRGVNVPSATAHVRIVLSASGTLRSASITKSSGIARIDAAAIEAVKRSGRFPAVPKGVTNPTLTFSIPMRFKR